jgi:hypothetical protein
LPEAIMATAGYIFCWMFGQAACVGLALGLHYWSAFLSLPQKVIDGYRWRDHGLNKTLNDDYIWWADYDEGGFWEFYSLKNFLIYAVPISGFFLLFAIAYFPERVEIMGRVCGAVGQVGIKPLFCA